MIVRRPAFAITEVFQVGNRSAVRSMRGRKVSLGKRHSQGEVLNREEGQHSITSTASRVNFSRQAKGETLAKLICSPDA